MASGNICSCDLGSLASQPRFYLAAARPRPFTTGRLHATVASAAHCPPHNLPQIMERSWATLFNCWNPDVVANCACNKDEEPCLPGSCGCTDDLQTGAVPNKPGKAPV